MLATINVYNTSFKCFKKLIARGKLSRNRSRNSRMISCVCSLSLQLESFNFVFVGNLTAQCSVQLTAASICTAALASAIRRPMKYLYANTVRFIVLLPAIWRQDRRWYTTRWSVGGRVPADSPRRGIGVECVGDDCDTR